jgi:type IV pilus assembly protein PilB
MAVDVVNGRILKKMVERGLLKETDASLLLEEKKDSSEPMAELILKHKFLEPSELTTFLAKELGCSPVPLKLITIDDELIRLIPPNFAQKYHVLPVARQNNALTVAMENPANIPLVDDIQAITNLKVTPVLALPSELKKAIDQHYPIEQKPKVSSEEMIQKLAQMVREKQGEDFEQDTVNLVRWAQETPVIKVANIFLLDAIRKKASDLFIEPWENELRVRLRVDGILEEIYTPPKAIGSALISRFKVMSQLNIAERRIPQDGRFKIKIQNREVDIRVSIIPTSFGEKVCLRILDKKSQANYLERLGFTEKDVQMIKESSLKPHGMILVTGPTGSGKTTTLYSVLKFLDSPEKNITTVEDPVEYEAEGINQVNVRDSIGLTFPVALRSILRQDPDIILIGEIRDLTTMDIAIKAALTGHLVLSTLHTNDTTGSIVRILNMGIEPFLITSSVIMISAQRLVRMLCEHCKVSFEANENVIQRLGLEKKKSYTLYRPAGCVKCRTTGYKGRSVISELLMLTPSIQELIMSRASGEDIKQQARREGMTTLRESGIQKAIEGVTSVDEVLRVTAGDQELEVE